MFVDVFDQLVTRIYRYQDSHQSLDHIKDDIYEFLDNNYETYLNASSEERDAIRRFVRKHHTSHQRPNLLALFLIGYVQRASEKIKSTGDKTWLIRGLTVSSMENGILDPRDSTFSLAYLYVMAEEKDLDPKPEFQAFSESSSDEILPGITTSMKELIKTIPNIARRTYNDWKEFS